ncbi:MAG: hypothetical protein M0Z33_08530 [Actinomycetota bacterium]|nr:hypothetical protein [Actinomycetota bacterium]
MVSANCSTKPATSTRRIAPGTMPRAPAPIRSTTRSSSTAATTPGLRIFTTTRLPSWSVAACTWPMEAAARGTQSKVS